MNSVTSKSQICRRRADELVKDYSLSAFTGVSIKVSWESYVRKVEIILCGLTHVMFYLNHIYQAKL